MIGLVRGTLVDRTARGEVLVDVGGLGYRVLVAPGTFGELGPLGGTVTLHTHLHVREDALVLYGFATVDERSCFEALLGAHGVGPALAQAILAVHRPSALRQLLAEDDVDGLCLVPGVGRKTATRLLLELKTRLDVPQGDLTALLGAVADEGGRERREVREALATLGYGPDEIREALRDLPDEGDAASQLRAALGRVGSVR
ncbi:MAG TPA: Holliday junction branch migration protein RuvA [Acidimicrobiales bacterium]